jgi:hypothetical protein
MIRRGRWSRTPATHCAGGEQKAITKNGSHWRCPPAPTPPDRPIDGGRSTTGHSIRRRGRCRSARPTPPRRARRGGQLPGRLGMINTRCASANSSRHGEAGDRPVVRPMARGLAGRTSGRSSDGASATVRTRRSRGSKLDAAIPPSPLPGTSPCRRSAASRRNSALRSSPAQPATQPGRDHHSYDGASDFAHRAFRPHALGTGRRPDPY